MAEENILDQIEKKGHEIARSNEELATKLQNNKELVARFSKELEVLKKDMADQGAGSASKDDLERLKSDLEEKRDMISGLMDSLKPLEVDIDRRTSLTGALQQRIDDQAARIESLSRDLLANRKQLQQFVASNDEFRKQGAAKDAMVQVLKDKLSEKTSLLNETTDKNLHMAQEVDSYKKSVFAFENKVGAVEKRVFATNEQNQKLLYELMQFKERLKSAEHGLDERDRLIASKDATSARNLEDLRRSEEEKRVAIMKNHSKKLAVMNATVSALKAKLEKQQELIDQKSKKERDLMTEFSRGMKDIMMTKVEASVDLSDYESLSENPAEDYGAEFRKAGTSGDSSEAAGEITDDAVKDMFNIPSPESAEESDTPTTEKSPGPSRIDEIIPMIELALDHGDNSEKIKHSLHSSGYSEKDVQSAFERLNIIQ